VRARFGQAAGVQRREARAHRGVEFIVGDGCAHARQPFGGADVAGIALEHVGKQRLRLGQSLRVLGVLGVGQRGHHAARGRDLGEPSVASLLPGSILSAVWKPARDSRIRRRQRAFAFGICAASAAGTSRSISVRTSPVAVRRLRSFVLAALEHAADVVERLAGRGEIRPPHCAAARESRSATRLAELAVFVGEFLGLLLRGDVRLGGPGGSCSVGDVDLLPRSRTSAAATRLHPPTTMSTAGDGPAAIAIARTAVSR
jgi:hypothetical protein